MSVAREPLRRIVVAGAGQLGVLAAIGLKRAVPGAEVVVLGLPRDPGALADRAVTALPFTNRLHDRLGIAEDDIVSRAQGSHRLVTRYFNWAGRGQSGAVTYGSDAEPALRSRFAMEWGGGPRNAAGPVFTGSLAEVLADAGRFAVPPSGRDFDETTPLADIDYALRWDPEAYRAILVSTAQRLGVVHVAGDLLGVERNADGGLAAVAIEELGLLSADLFIDCSGSGARLLAAMEGYRNMDWQDSLPLRQLLFAHRQPGMIALEDRFTLLTEGWIGELAGRDGLRTTMGVASGVPEQSVLQALGAPPEEGLRIVPGRAAMPWIANVVALGDATARFEPIGYFNLDLAHRQLDLLLEMLPGMTINPFERNEYNRRSGLMMDAVRDALAAHYAAPLASTVFRPMPAEGALARQLDQFTRRGRMPFGEESPLLSAELQALFAALGHPRGQGPQQRAAHGSDSAAALRAFTARAQAALAYAPPYADWIMATAR